MSKKSKQFRTRRAELRRALDEIEEIRGDLGAAYTNFNSTSDPDLVSACVYEINALMARYDHALRRAKSRFDGRTMEERWRPYR